MTRAYPFRYRYTARLGPTGWRAVRLHRDPSLHVSSQYTCRHSCVRFGIQFKLEVATPVSMMVKREGRSRRALKRPSAVTVTPQRGCPSLQSGWYPYMVSGLPSSSENHQSKRVSPTVREVLRVPCCVYTEVSEHGVQPNYRSPNVITYYK